MIRLLGVTKDYEGHPGALSNVDLEIGKGEFVWIVGPSGAGKTTLFKLLLCEESVNAGRIYAQGKALIGLKRSSLPYLRRQIGCVFQDFKLLFRKTVFDNVALPLRIIGLSRRHIRQRVSQILQALSLERRADRLPEDLSSGERQRVAIARALVTRPAIVLADEPMVHQDEKLQEKILALLKDIHLQGATVLVATHRESIPPKAGQRRILLEGGRVVLDQMAAAG